ncbi:MAG: TerB family tellurite resistance protein [Alphaproteobacteria bacterium]|nr:TerB family tellurite resistance protein [Alphaproteobacteria bacterium]
MLDGLRQVLAERYERHKHRPFLEACMATCALVAIADGEVSLSERGRLDQIIDAIDRLSIFDVHEAVDLFNETIDAIKANPVDGRKQALKPIAECRSEAGDAVLLVKVALAVGQVDGVLLASERAQCEVICKALGLNLSDFE